MPGYRKTIPGTPPSPARECVGQCRATRHSGTAQPTPFRRLHGVARSAPQSRLVVHNRLNSRSTSRTGAPGTASPGLSNARLFAWSGRPAVLRKSALRVHQSERWSAVTNEHASLRIVLAASPARWRRRPLEHRAHVPGRAPSSPVGQGPGLRAPAHRRLLVHHPPQPTRPALAPGTAALARVNARLPKQPPRCTTRLNPARSKACAQKPARHQRIHTARPPAATARAPPPPQPPQSGCAQAPYAYSCDADPMTLGQWI